MGGGGGGLQGFSLVVPFWEPPKVAVSVDIVSKLEFSESGPWLWQIAGGGGGETGGGN